MSGGAGKREIEESSCELPEGKKAKTQPRVLYILTPYWLLGIEIQADEIKAGQPSPVPSTPSFETRLDLKGRYPVGMGFVKSKSQSQILFFGGFTRDDYRDPELDVNEPNLDVFTLNRHKQSLDLVQRFGEMQACKRRPIVEEFGEKIFVFHLGVNGLFNQPPLLERLHLPNGEWKELPNLPGVWRLPGKAAQVRLPGFAVGFGHFVAFNKIVIPVRRLSGDTAYCFDMDLEVWDELTARNFTLSFQNAELELPQFGRSFSGLGEQYSQHCSLILSPGSDMLGQLTLVAQMVHKSGNLLLYQVVESLHLMRHLDVAEVDDFQTLDMEDGRHMCLLVSFVLAGRPCLGALYMCIFEVVILHDVLGDACTGGTFPGTPQSIGFVDVIIKEMHCYKIPELVEDDGFSCMKALFL